MINNPSSLDRVNLARLHVYRNSPTFIMTGKEIKEAVCQKSAELPGGSKKQELAFETYGYIVKLEGLLDSIFLNRPQMKPDRYYKISTPNEGWILACNLTKQEITKIKRILNSMSSAEYPRDPMKDYNKFLKIKDIVGLSRIVGWIELTKTNE